MELQDRFPLNEDLRKRARRRMPHFAFEYLDSGTGDDSAHNSNHSDLDAVRLMPGVLEGPQEVDLTTELLGRKYAMPFGIAPVGMSGVMWPGAEEMLAREAVRSNIPYCMSSMANATPEQLAPHLGETGWFQLYPPGDVEIRSDLLKRVKDAGFRALVLTVDVAVASRRERQRKAHVTQPPKMTPRIFFNCATKPVWSLAMLKQLQQYGWPRIQTLEKYADVRATRPGTDHIGYKLRIAPDLEYLEWLRDTWDGPLVVKGIMDAAPVSSILEAGADALWVSNHGGRQFSASPSSIEVLPAIREVAGPDVPIIFDSGIRSGTDVLRAIALGADFAMLGRTWHWGVAALGEPGAAHVTEMLRDSMVCDMGQMAITRPRDVRARLA